ncbi:MAG: apolipoprotein N-acyltransferase [Acidimicrobiia bacterium]
MRQILSVVVSAVLLWLSFPPVNLGILVFVAPIPFLWTMRRTRSAGEAGWLGLLYGGIFFGLLMSWLQAVGFWPWMGTTLIMAVWTTAFGLVLFAARAWTPWRWWVASVGAWAAWEALRSRFPFGGLTWGSVGDPIGTLAWPRGSAQWIGSSGWAVIVVGAAAGVVLAFDEEADRRPAELMAMIIVALTLLGAIFVPAARGDAVRVAVVQGSTPCPAVHCDGEEEQIYRAHLEATTLLESGSVDLIVWGEDSFGGNVNPTFDGAVNREISSQASVIGAYIVAAGTRPSVPGTYDKYSVVYDLGGQIVGEYMKRHAVPFGEYIPLRGILQFLPQVGEGREDMNRGGGPGVFPAQFGERAGVIGTVLSYEATVDRLVRSTVSEGAQLVIVHANTASFGPGAVSEQMIGMLRMTAPSLGVDIVVASVSGRSTIIRADGSIGRTTGLFESDVLRGTVNFQVARRTVYVGAGDWLQVAAIMAAAAVAVGSIGGPSRDFRIRPGHSR